MNTYWLIAMVLGGVSLALTTIGLGVLWNIQRMRKTFFIGKNASQLEDFIVNQNKRITELATQANYIEEALKQTKEQQRLAIQKMGVVRYNPFADNGGNLSFSLALMDDHDNGVVITSMHGRETNRIYAKPVKNGSSEFSLTEEERKAISESKIINSF